MLPGMIGGYLLGSDSEAISFAPGGVVYRRAGATHAVDPRAPVNARAVRVGYALCGTPVRIWPDESFDPTARVAPDRCVTLAGAVSTGVPPAAR